MGPETKQKLSQLSEPLRSRVARLLEQTGDAVWIVSGTRSTEEQVQLRRAHCGSSFYDIWQKPASQCNPPTAIPGRSQHERGLAVDLGGNLALAERLARAAGLESNVAGEAWHFEPTGGGAAIQGIRIPIPGGGIDVPNPLDPVGDAMGWGVDQIKDAVASVLEDMSEPFLEGLARIALTGVLIAGGVTLVALGGIRSTSGGRS